MMNKQISNIKDIFIPLAPSLSFVVVEFLVELLFWGDGFGPVDFPSVSVDLSFEVDSSVSEATDDIFESSASEGTDDCTSPSTMLNKMHKRR